MTHFSDADGPLGIGDQAATFEAATSDLPGERCLSNSAAVLRHNLHARQAAQRLPASDWVRTGIALYGSAPDFGQPDAVPTDLQATMSLRSQVIAIQQLQAGDTVMLCPTIAPQDTEAVAARLAEQGVATLDAPMSGGPQRAELGTMSLMVAGADAVFERHQDILYVLAQPIFRISQRVGDGARTKLVNNLLAGINLVGAAEALALAERLGLDAERTLQVMAASSAQSWIASDRMPRALGGDFAPRAHMTLLEKDTALAVQAAESAGFTGPLGPLAAQVFARASAAGLAEWDDAAVLTYLRGRS